MNYSSLIIWGWECNFRDAIGAEIGGFRFFDDISLLHICCDTRRLCTFKMFTRSSSFRESAQDGEEKTKTVLLLRNIIHLVQRWNGWRCN